MPAAPCAALALLLLPLATVCSSASDHDKLPFLHASYRTGHHAEVPTARHLRRSAGKEAQPPQKGDVVGWNSLVGRSAIVAERFVLKPKPQNSPFECHAATIVETAKDGEYVAAWFQGTEENAPDVAVYTSRIRLPKQGTSNASAWSVPRRAVAPVSTAPVKCGRGTELKCKGQMSTWNPALAQLPNGTTLLFYKRGPSPTEWTGYLSRSEDGGKSFGKEERLPKGIVCAAKNAPVVLHGEGEQGGGGVHDANAWTLACGASTEAYGAATATGGQTRKWQLYTDLYDAKANAWQRHGPVPFDGNAIQPALFVHPKLKTLAMIARSATDYDLHAGKKVMPYRDPKNRKRMLYPGKKYAVIAAAKDRLGKVWVRPAQPINVPCPNSGLDAVALPDGRLVVVHNDWDLKSRTDEGEKSDGPMSRSRLVVSVSEPYAYDRWRVACVLEDATKARIAPGRSMGPEYSYPSAALSRTSGLLHVVYTYERRGIKHATIDPAKL